MRMLLLLAIHAAALAFAVWTTLRTGERPQVILYAFIIESLLRLVTIDVMLRALACGSAGVRQVVLALTSPPARGQRPEPVRMGDGPQAPPAGLGGYVVVLCVLTGFALVLANVGSDRQIETTTRQFERDLAWGLLVALVYWSDGLASGLIVLDPAASRPLNFGYNTRDVTILALAVLTAASVVGVRQEMGLPATGWAVLGPLLGFRALWDVWAALQPLDEPAAADCD